MIEKYSDADDFNFNEAPVAIINEQQDLVKRAAARDLKHGKGEKDQTDVHIIALGSYEGYGCFFDGALVNTKSGFREIQTLKEGEEVLTHKGRYRKIVKTFQKEYSGDQAKITLSGGAVLTCTANHPWLVQSAVSVETGVSVNSAEWTRADAVVVGDVFFSPIPVLDGKDYRHDTVSSVSITSPNAAVTIYNFEVDEDNSYCVNNWAAHNSNRNLDSFSEEDCRNNHSTFLKAGGMPDGRGVCRNHKNKKTDPRFGTIKQSSYNEKMRRVELVVGLDNEKCAEEVQTLASGGQISFSMGSKQPWDVCSECGHKSYNGDDDRCTHIKNNLGDITKTGSLVHMKNPNPNWFEISLVRKPADRVAYSIKTASPHLLPKHAQEADVADVPDNLKISKKASDKLSLVKKLAEIEKHLDAVSISSKDKLHKMKASREGLSKETIEELRKYDPAKLLKELADNGIVFTPAEFMHYLFADKVKEKDVDGMKSHLRDSFSKVEKCHGGEVANNERFEPAQFGALPSIVKRMIEKLKSSHSFFGEPATRRVMQITIMGGMRPKEAQVLEKTSSVYDEKMAEQYTAYKLAALNYLDEQGKLDDDVLNNSVWQNRL